MTKPSAEIEKQIAKSAYNAKIKLAERKRKYENVGKHKIHSLVKPNTQVADSLRSPFLENITQYNHAHSILGVVAMKKPKLKLHTRFIGCKILAFAKLQIAKFIHSIIKLFHFSTMPAKVKEQLLQRGITEVHPSMILTDTDSCSWFFSLIGDINQPRQNENDVKEMLEKIIISNLSALLDLSDPYFEKYGVRNAAQRKQMGLFAFENIDGINVTIGVNPKEYIEVYQDMEINKKHKGLKRSTVGMDFDMYADRVRFMNENKRRADAFIAKKFTQKRLQAIYGQMQQVTLEKVSFGKLNDKCYYFTDGLLSLPHGHPALQPIYDRRRGMTEQEVQQDLEESERLEKLIPQKNRRLHVTSAILNASVKFGVTVREFILNTTDITNFEFV